MAAPPHWDPGAVPGPGDQRLRRSCGLAPLRGNAGWAWTEADARSSWPRPTTSARPPPTGLRSPGAVSRSGPAQPSLDSELSEYIDAGPPPVAVTLGTSAASGGRQKFARIAADIDKAHLRSVLLVGHEQNLGSRRHAPRGRHLRSAHDTAAPVLRRGGCSGALGGLAAALTAGVPVVRVTHSSIKAGTPGELPNSASD